MNRLETCLGLFDAYNQQDPHTIVFENENYPAEYFYALQLYNWVKKFEPGASEFLLLASRAQHIGRWKTPRTNYAEGKAGYLTWRKDLSKFHAHTAGELMLQVGYEHDEIKAVKHIILKEDLKFDAEVQVMENSLCLVFLQFQFEDFLSKHDNDDMIIRILRKTWSKMNDKGRAEALQLSYPPRGKDLINKALSAVADAKEKTTTVSSDQADGN